MPNTVNPPLATDDISPMTAGDTSPVWNPTIQDKFGVAINLTGLVAGNFQLKMKNEASGIIKVGAGVFTIVNAAAGIITYAWNSADTSAAGEWLLSVIITWPSGPQHLDLYVLVINPTI